VPLPYCENKGGLWDGLIVCLFLIVKIK
jgi:hypothetical protein